MDRIPEGEFGLAQQIAVGTLRKHPSHCVRFLGGRLQKQLFEPSEFLLIHTSSHGGPPCPGAENRKGDARYQKTRSFTTYIREAHPLEPPNLDPVWLRRQPVSILRPLLTAIRVLDGPRRQN
jgi:hypothetical protein